MAKGLSASQKVAFALLLAVFLALYLNIGWAIGTYFYHHVVTKEPITSIEKFLSGGFDLVYHHNTATSLLTTQIFMMLAWPFYLAMLITSWLAYGVWLVLWLIFAGGLAKLVGLG